MVSERVISCSSVISRSRSVPCSECCDALIFDCLCACFDPKTPRHGSSRENKASLPTPPLTHTFGEPRDLPEESLSCSLVVFGARGLLRGSKFFQSIRCDVFPSLSCSPFLMDDANVVSDRAGVERVNAETVLKKAFGRGSRLVQTCAR